MSARDAIAATLEMTRGSAAYGTVADAVIAALETPEAVERVGRALYERWAADRRDEGGVVRDYVDADGEDIGYSNGMARAAIHALLHGEQKP